MGTQRVGIGWVMVAIAVLAINLGVLRASYLRSGRFPNETRTKVELWARGSLPMANLLALGILIAPWRHAGRPAVVGFVSFGIVAMVAFAAVVNYVCEWHYIEYSAFVPGPIRKIHVLSQVVASIVLVLPQLAFALIGRFLFRKLGSSNRRTCPLQVSTT